MLTRVAMCVDDAEWLKDLEGEGRGGEAARKACYGSLHDECAMSPENGRVAKGDAIL